MFLLGLLGIGGMFGTAAYFLHRQQVAIWQNIGDASTSSLAGMENSFAQLQQIMDNKNAASTATVVTPATS